jgi:prepilin-type N-terminal cleavage/methylation domain-containing protein
MKRGRGYSLLELLSVIAILGLIAGFVIPTYFGSPLVSKGKGFARGVEVSVQKLRTERWSWSASYSYSSPPQRPSNVQQDDGRSAAYTPRYERSQDRYRYSSWQNQDRCRYSSWYPATVVWLNDPGKIGPTPWDWRKGLMIYTCGPGPTQVLHIFRIEMGQSGSPVPSTRR